MKKWYARVQDILETDEGCNTVTFSNKFQEEVISHRANTHFSPHCTVVNKGMIIKILYFELGHSNKVRQYALINFKLLCTLHVHTTV